MTKLAFMSTTAPTWTMQQLVDGALRLGYEGVDLRVEWSHEHGLELSSSKAARRDARDYAAAKKITWSCVALSTRFARASDAERQEAVEQVKRYAELASDVGSPLLRVFGGPIPEGHTMEQLRPRTAEFLGKAAEVAVQWGVTPCLEVHDHHNNPDDVKFIMENAGHANVGAVWHVAHHVRLGVSVDDGYATLKPWIRHLHIQELPKGYEAGQPPPYTRVGEGNDYLARVFELLEKDKFGGFAANEWAASGNWKNAGATRPEHYDAQHPDESLGNASKHLHRWRDTAQSTAR